MSASIWSSQSFWARWKVNRALPEPMALLTMTKDQKVIPANENYIIRLSKVQENYVD